MPSDDELRAVLRAWEAAARAAAARAALGDATRWALAQEYFPALARELLALRAAAARAETTLATLGGNRAVFSGGDAACSWCTRYGGEHYPGCVLADALAALREAWEGGG